MTADEALIAKLVTAIGRVDSGSTGGYLFRLHVAQTDLLPLVRALIAEGKADALRDAADAIESVWEGSRDFSPQHAGRQLRVRATEVRP